MGGIRRHDRRKPDCQLILLVAPPVRITDPEHAASAREALEKANAPVSIMIDCSHANSGKDPVPSTPVLDEVLCQVEGDRTVFMP